MSEDEAKMKEDSFESSEEEEDESFGPAALGLHRVGTELPKKKKGSPLQKLNARGRPARIRKKNSKYDDEMEEAKSPTKGSPTKKPIVKTPVSSPVKPVIKSAVKKQPQKPRKSQKEDIEDSENENAEHEEDSSDSVKSGNKVVKRGAKKKVTIFHCFINYYCDGN